MNSTTITIDGLMMEKADSLRASLRCETEGNVPVFETLIAENSQRIDCFEAAIRDGADAEVVALWTASVEHLKSERESNIRTLEYIKARAEVQRTKLAAVERFLASREAA